MLDCCCYTPSSNKWARQLLLPAGPPHLNRSLLWPFWRTRGLSSWVYIPWMRSVSFIMGLGRQSCPCYQPFSFISKDLCKMSKYGKPGNVDFTWKNVQNGRLVKSVSWGKGDRSSIIYTYLIILKKYAESRDWTTLINTCREEVQTELKEALIKNSFVM